MTAACPIGSIIMFGGHTDQLPTGWLYCNGDIVSRKGYEDLFNVIGHNFGNRIGKLEYDPDRQFFLPDLRGRFVRGVDDGVGRDPDAAQRTDMQSSTPRPGIGSVQPDALRRHSHEYRRLKWGGDDCSGRVWGHEDVQTGESGGNETRPLNAAVYFIIRAS